MRISIIKEHEQEIRQQIRENDGHCACVPAYARTGDTKCICKEFLESKAGTICHCGLYKKEED